LASTGNGLEVVSAGGGRDEFVRHPRWLPVQWLAKYVNARDESITWHEYPSEHFALKDVSGGISSYLPCPTSEIRCFFAGYRDSLGRELRVDRDEMRNLTGLTSPNGNWIRLNHGPQGRIEEIVDSQGRRVRYDYDERNRLTTVTYPSGEVYQYTYDDTQHLLSFSVAPDAHSTFRVLLKNEYGDGLPIKQTVVDNSVYEYEYQSGPHGQIRAAAVRMPDGRTFNIDVTDASSVIHETSVK
jgi:YD repeat-containing protein